MQEQARKREEDEKLRAENERVFQALHLKVSSIDQLVIELRKNINNPEAFPKLYETLTQTIATTVPEVDKALETAGTAAPRFNTLTARINAARDASAQLEATNKTYRDKFEEEKKEAVDGHAAVKSAYEVITAELAGGNLPALEAAKRSRESLLRLHNIVQLINKSNSPTLKAMLPEMQQLMKDINETIRVQDELAREKAAAEQREKTERLEKRNAAFQSTSVRIALQNAVLIEDSEAPVTKEMVTVLDDLSKPWSQFNFKTRQTIENVRKRLKPKFQEFSTQQGIEIRKAREEEKIAEEKRIESLKQAKQAVETARVRAQIAVLEILIPKNRLSGNPLPRAELARLCPKVKDIDLLFEGRKEPNIMNKFELETFQYIRVCESQKDLRVGHRPVIVKFVRRGENDTIIGLHEEQEKEIEIEKDGKLQITAMMDDIWTVIDSTVITENISLSGLKIVKRMNIGDKIRQLGPLISHEGAMRMKVIVETAKIPTEGDVVGYITLSGTKGTHYIERDQKRRGDEIGDQNPPKVRKIAALERKPRYMVVGDQCKIVAEKDGDDPMTGVLESWEDSGMISVARSGNDELVQASASRLRFADGGECRKFIFDETGVDNAIRERMGTLEDDVDEEWRAFNDANDRLDAGAPDADKLLRTQYPKMQESLEKFKTYCKVRYVDVEALEIVDLRDSFRELITGHNEKQRKLNQVYSAFQKDAEKRMAEKAQREFEEKRAENDRIKKEEREKREEEVEKHKTCIEEATLIVDSITEGMDNADLLSTLDEADTMIKPAVEFLESTNADNETGNLLMQAIKLKTRIARALEENTTAVLADQRQKIREFLETPSATEFLDAESWQEADFETRGLPVPRGITFPIDRKMLDVFVKDWYIPETPVSAGSDRDLIRECVEILDTRDGEVKISSLEDGASAWCKKDKLAPVPLLYKIIKDTVLTSGLEQLDVLLRLKAGDQVEVRARPGTYRKLLRCYGRVRDVYGWFTVDAPGGPYAKGIC